MIASPIFDIDFDGRLVMEQAGEQRAGADQVAGRDEDRVVVAVTQLLDQCRHVLGAAGRDRIFLVLSLGSAILMPPGGGIRLPWKSLMARMRKLTGAVLCARVSEAGPARTASVAAATIIRST